ncbi:MAG: hypothetical protein R3C05_03205 [Pirellulaceae bacterium]
MTHDGGPSLWSDADEALSAAYKASVCKRLVDQGTIVLEVACLSHDQVQHNNAILSGREFIHRSRI